MYLCCICKSSRNDSILHHFPASEKRLKRWLKCLNRDELSQLSAQELFKHVVCQKHFEKRFVTVKSRLVGKAYPTLFTVDEISSGKPNHGKAETVDPKMEHSYSRKRHFDHTYSQVELLEGMELPDPTENTPIQNVLTTPVLPISKDSGTQVSFKCSKCAELKSQQKAKVWQTSATGLERCGVAFLPVNPALSAPRNQGRQKLARLSTPELRALLRDVLLDAARRQRLATLQPRGLSAPAHAFAPGIRLRQSQMSDDEPLYDSVASDDDYAALTTLDIDQVSSMDPKTGETVSSTYNPSLPLSLEHSIEISFTPRQEILEKKDEIETLKKELDTRDSTITDLKNQLKSLQTIVEQLTKENSALKSTSSVDDDQSVASQASTGDLSPPERGRSLDGEPGDAARVRARPVSMFETREGPKNNWQVTKHQLTSIPGLERSLTQSVIEGGEGDEGVAGTSGLAGGPEEEVQRRAEAVTRCIQELWAAARLQRQKLPECADAIQTAAASLLALFPQTCSDSSLQQVLDELRDASEDVVSACMTRAPIERVRAAAYELAKATKRLVTRYQPS